MPTTNTAISTSPKITPSDLVYYLRRSRVLRQPISPSLPPPEVPMIAWILFGSGALITTIAEVFGVPMSIAAKWISDGNGGEYDGLQAVGTFYDALVNQVDPETRAHAERLVDRLAKASDVHLRNYRKSARR